ncbi:hypothetical protein KP509_09G078700 [Ceratopteris richardii]|uniref:Uncharacterized protein n=1 Tax=Ceratopteris richardii TaxID=49495 RepID=A0A8T2U412_CERRI|nr:hypothetical protein KP509_09G078700 [Ceratopteris richardii]
MPNTLNQHKGRFCGSSQELGEYLEAHCQELCTLISALQASDEGPKLEAVQQLSLLLLYAIPNSGSTFTCPDAYTISLQLQNRNMTLALKDIKTLYKLISSELANHVAWLFNKGYGGKEAGKIVSNFTASSGYGYKNLDYIVKIAQCCIYIVPLLEFHTGLSIVASEALHSLFKQLVSSVNLFRICGKEFDKVANDYGVLLVKQCRDWDRRCDSCCHSGLNSKPLEEQMRVIETLSKHVMESLQNSHNADLFILDASCESSISCHTDATKMLDDRQQVAIALLEVFIEELLLRPRLASILNYSNALSSSQVESSIVKPTMLTLEAATSHFVLSFFAVDCTDVLQMIDEGFPVYHGYQLSLPAAVMLLDLVMDDEFGASQMFLVHVINVLRCSLESSCYSKAEHPREMFLGFAASALESAVNVYSKCQKSNSKQRSLQEGMLFKCLHEKILAACGGNVRKASTILDLLFIQENHLKPSLQGNGSQRYCSSPVKADTVSVGNDIAQCFSCPIHYNSVYTDDAKEKPLPTGNRLFSLSDGLFLNTNKTILVPVLHLINAALLHLVIGVAKQALLMRTTEYAHQLPSSADVYIRHIEEVFKFCSNIHKMEILEDLNLNKEHLDIIREVDRLTGNAFEYFAGRFCLCVKQAAPQAVTSAYLEVLNSLLSLGLLQQGRFLNSTYADKLLCQDQVRHIPQSLVKNLEEEKVENAQTVNGSKDHIANDMETLAIARFYQRRHKDIVSTYRNTSMDSGFQNSQEVGNVRESEMLTPKYRTSENGKAYISHVKKCFGAVEGQCFDDLSDFIVCKEGRDYSSYIKLKYKKRKERIRKTLCQRIKARKALAALLKSKGNRFF